MTSRNTTNSRQGEPIANWDIDAGLEVWSFVLTANEESLAAVAGALTDAATADPDIGVKLGHNDPIFRLLGLAKAVSYLGAGRDSASAIAMAAPLIDGLLEVPPRVELKAEFRTNLLLSLSAALSIAAQNTGRPEIVIRVADLATCWSEVPQQVLEEGAVRALIQTFRMADAAERYERISPTPELGQLLRGWRPAADESDTFNPRSLAREDEAGRLDHAARQAAVRWVGEQRQVLAQHRAAMAEVNHSQACSNSYSHHLAECEDTLETVERDVINGAPHGASEIFHTQIFRFQEAARGLLGLADEGGDSAFDAQRRVNRATRLIATASRTRGELEHAAREVQDAIQWYADHSDRSGATIATWALALMELELGREVEALGSLRKVFHALVYVVDGVHTAAECAASARTLPGIYWRLIPLAVRHGDIATAFWASETLRGLAITNGMSLTSVATPEAPGCDWHYFSVYVEKSSTVAFLRTADGELHGEMIDLGPDELDALVARASPASWRKSRLRDAGSPRSRLSNLLAPLEAALLDGRISVGDHIVTALDYPVHLVPIHYLDLADRLAVESFSFSRVSSLADAVELAGRQAGDAPRDAAVFAIPAADNDHELHLAACEEAVVPLRDAGLSFPMLSGSAATDKESIIAALRDSQLVHIQAHGHFPVAAPRQTVDSFGLSGLLVSSNGELPDRSHPENFLISPSHIVRAGRLGARHVSLSACVSGLGRPGVGGDILGLEFSLRLQGCGSVTASHWNIDLELAARFHQHFYRRWVVERKPKAQAWRLTVLDLLQENREDEAARANACAFSLYGSWK